MKNVITDIDECSGDNPCQQECINLEGSYWCGCMSGWILDGLPDENPSSCVSEYFLNHSLKLCIVNEHYLALV